MDPYLTTPKTEKESSEETCDRLSYGVSSMQGWRKNQEDAYNCIINYDTDTSYFAIYDGHGGPEVSNYCAQNLPDFIRNSELYKNGDIEDALITSFLHFDQTLTKREVKQKLQLLHELHVNKERIPTTFGEKQGREIKVSNGFIEAVGEKSGSTAVVAILKGNQLYVANAGDSRCILCRNGEAIALSFDHKPYDNQEYERIVKAGGNVDVYGEGRIDNGLNLSRAIGDHFYKQRKDLSNIEQKVIALPDIQTLTINPKEDEFLFLASDGIWNLMKNEEVIEFVRRRLKNNVSLSEILEQMFEAGITPSVGLSGSDNMSAIIVKFKSLPCNKKETLSQTFGMFDDSCTF